MIDHPISVYINWAAYDELSDNIELTEALAMRQLQELLRLREFGVRFDYYLMDAFWYSKDGAYRSWRKPHWSSGPDAWLQMCLSNGILPGLWVAGNSTHSHEPVPAWRNSLTADRRSMCMFSGGFLNHFLESLHIWYERGVRMFKFDFMNMQAATPEIERTLLPSEIRAMNQGHLLAGLKSFRQQHPEVVLLAYNGFEEYPTQNDTTSPFRKSVDVKWLEGFDSIYCGDPRPADVPAMNFWRSKDIYSDHMVRIYQLNVFPLPRIDNSGFMIGTTGTCYYRKTAAWKSMLLLSLARGGWVNTYYGNLDLLSDVDAQWFAKAQDLYMSLQAYGRFSTFGALPGSEQPYGFSAAGREGTLHAILNPSQSFVSVALPSQPATQHRILFSDAGFVLVVDGGQVTLGPEQMAVVGTGIYSDVKYDLGLQDDVVIPNRIEPLQPLSTTEGDKQISVSLLPPEDGYIRIVMRQRDTHGNAVRTSGGSPPSGTSLGKLLHIEVEQNGSSIPVTINYDKAIWSGLSWAVGEIAISNLHSTDPIVVRCSSTKSRAVHLTCAQYHVVYA